ncbi:hypothetical protein HKX48_000136 [Thoreauomyces humboldtii]|nr:hypothetical protein HKX48_000136 [Thoreauomyces humboldtii]
MLRFEDCFWGTGEDPTAGVRALHTVFMQHLAEAEDLLTMVRARVASEEAYASNFLELGRHSGSVSSSPNILGLGGDKDSRRYSRASTPAIAAGTMTGLTGDRTNRMSLNNIALGLGNAAAKIQSAAASSGLPGMPSWSMTTEPDGDTSTVGPIDDQSSVRPVIRTIREQMVAMSLAHRQHADTLIMAVISPLQAFVEQHRKVMLKKKSEVDLNFGQLARLVSDIEARHLIYLQKCKICEEEDIKFREDGEGRASTSSRVNNGPVMIGSRSVGPNEFGKMVETMRKDVKTKSIMTELGLFENCFMGDDAIEHLRKKYPGVPRGDLKLICQEILARRLMTVIVGPNENRAFDPELPYQFGRPLLKTGEPPHVKARKDSEMARLEYDSAIKSAEHTRSALEFHITDYLLAVQEAEHYRLKVIKEAILAFESAQVFVLEEMHNAWRPAHITDALKAAASAPEGAEVAADAPPTTLLTSPDPTEGVQYIARRYRTGHLRSKPFVFESYKNGRAPHQVFGIGLEELSKVTKTPIPPVVRRCVAALYESLISGRSTVDTWIMPNPDLPSVQFLRLEFNSSPRGGRVSSATLKRYQPQVVAGILKLYLVEAPVSLCSYDTYETLRMLYSDDFQTFDDEVRVKSVKSLLTTLSPPHYETLKFFTAYLHELIANLPEDDERLVRLAYSIAPCILRPTNETQETLSDQHPWRFSMELMIRHVDLFGPVDKAALIAELQTSPSPEPEDEEDEVASSHHGSQAGDADASLRTRASSIAGSESTPPGTPPLREPVGKGTQGSWFPWPLTASSDLPTPNSTPGREPSPLSAVDETSDEHVALQIALAAKKVERRTSRLEIKLAGVLARAKGSKALPTDDTDDVPHSAVSRSISPSTPGADSPNSPPELERKPSIYRMPSVAEVTSVAKSFLGMGAVTEAEGSTASPAPRSTTPAATRTTVTTPAQDPIPVVELETSPYEDVINDHHAAVEASTRLPAELATSPYEDVINADHPPAPSSVSEPVLHEAIVEEEEEEAEEEVYTETESVYEDGEEEYTDGEEVYEEHEYTEEELEEVEEEEEEEYEETEEVVIDGDADHQPAVMEADVDGEEVTTMFPDAQNMDEYLQWG